VEEVIEETPEPVALPEVR
jgi:hypothetical protein